MTAVLLLALAADPTPAERLRAIEVELKAELKANRTEVKDPATSKTSHRFTLTPSAKYLPRLLELGRSADEQTAYDALTLAVFTWLADDPAGDPATTLLGERFGGSPRFADFARRHAQYGYDGQDKRLKRLLAAATDHTARGLLLLDLALAIDPNRVHIVDEPLDQTQARIQQTAAVYRQVMADYTDVDDGKVAKRAERYLSHLDLVGRVQVGQPAPPTAGPDIDGRPMTLADYRGRIVVLDFWGSWCAPCRLELPGLRAVADKYADRGVVVLGVMSESKPADALAAVRYERVGWPNWLDLRADGSPLVEAWGVTGFPTVFVIDRAGVVRGLRLHGREAVEKLIDQLLAER